MAEPDTEPTGGAQIESIFRLSGRGWVLLFAAVPETFSGRILSDGIVQSDRGVAPYKGPKHVRHSDGRPTLAVLVNDDANALFEVGQTIRFYKRIEPDKG